MASPTKVHMTRVRLKKRKQARKRKNQLARRGSTLSRDAFFGELAAPAAVKPPC